MSVPDFQKSHAPCTQGTRRWQETSAAEVRERVAAAESLTVDDMREMLPSGRQSVLVNRDKLGRDVSRTRRLSGTHLF